VRPKDGAILDAGVVFRTARSSLGSGGARGRLDGIRARIGFLRLALDVWCRAIVPSATSGAKPDIGRGPVWDDGATLVA